MKKVLSILLTVAIFATMLMSVSAAAPAGAYLDVESGEYVADTGVIATEYVDINFDDAYIDVSSYVTDGALNIAANSYAPVVTTNAATTDKTVSITVARNKTATTNTAAEIPTSALSSWYHPVEKGAYEDGSINYAFGGANRKQSAKFKFEIDGGVAGGENELVYFDFKMKRNTIGSGEDNGSIYIQDASGNNITTFYFAYSKEMRVSAGSKVNYGGDLSSNAPYSTDWKQYRMIMDFSKKTFELYVGDDINTLMPYLNTVESYTMQSNSATNFALLNDTDKPSFTYDDFKVYTVTPPVAPEASEVTMTGKPNLGETLTMTYGAYACEGDIAEGASYCYWEASDDNTFISSTKLTDEIPVKAGDTNEYVITDATSGKYVRCVVVPVNEAGIEGDKVYSDATAYAVDDIVLTPGIDGNIKNNTVFDFKHTNNYYAGKVTFTSTLSTVKNYTLVGAWYVSETDEEGNKIQRLVSVKALPITIENAAETEAGVVTGSFTTDTVYIMPKAEASLTEPTMKVMLVDSLSTMKPVCNYKYAGTNF